MFIFFNSFRDRDYITKFNERGNIFTLRIKSSYWKYIYFSSKFGLRGFTTSLREELREYNIKVISVHPGAVDTPFWNNVNVDFPKDEMMSSDDVAESIVHAILAPNNVVQEEVVIRRTGGDF